MCEAGIWEKKRNEEKCKHPCPLPIKIHLHTQDPKPPGNIRCLATIEKRKTGWGEGSRPTATWASLVPRNLSSSSLIQYPGSSS